MNDGKKINFKPCSKVTSLQHLTLRNPTNYELEKMRPLAKRI